MFTSSRTKGWLLMAIAWCGLFSALSSGQIPGAMNETTATNLGGNSYVVGTVFAPDGKPLTYRMRIKLVSLMRGEIITRTDDRGQFLFSGVSAGQYLLVIDGEKEFENVSQQIDVEISRSASPQLYTSNIRLADRRSPDTSQKPGIVLAGDATASKKAVSLYKEAIERSRADDHKGAISKLKSSLAESPGYLSAINELGAQYMILGDLASAEQHLRSALAINAEAIEPTLNLGICLFRAKRYAEVEPLLKKAIGMDERSAVAHFYLGRSYMASERADDAIRELNDALKVGGDQFKEAHRLLAILYIDKREPAKVVAELEAYLKLVPDARDADELRSVIKQAKAAIPK